MWSYITNNILRSSYDNIQKNENINRSEIEEKTLEIANATIPSLNIFERSKNFLSTTYRNGKEAFNYVKSEINHIGEEFDNETYDNYGLVEGLNEDYSEIEGQDPIEDEDLIEKNEEIDEEESPEVEDENSVENQEKMEEIIEETPKKNTEVRIPEESMEVNHEEILETKEEELLENHDLIKNELSDENLSLENIRSKIQHTNIPGNSTQQVLSEALKSLVDAGYHPQIKSKLESDEEGYALETFIKTIAQGNVPQKICYKIKVTYLIIPDPSKMDEVISVERYIFTNVELGTSREKVLFAASWYKEFIIALSKNPSKCLKGYEESKRDELMVQRTFAFNYTPNAEGGMSIKTIKPMSFESLKGIELQLNEKKKFYIESIDFRTRDSGKAKRLKKLGGVQKSEIVYSSKELALQNARTHLQSDLIEQLRETNTVQHYIEKIQEEANEKQKELDQVRARLIRSSLFGKSKESASLKQFIDYMKTEDSEYIALKDKQVATSIDDLEYLKEFRDKRIGQELTEEDSLKLKKLVREYISQFKNWNLDRIKLSGDNYNVSKIVQLIISKIEERIEILEEQEKKNLSSANEHYQIKLDFARFQKLNQDLYELNIQLEELSRDVDNTHLSERQKIWQINEQLIQRIFDKISDRFQSEMREEEPKGNFNQIVAGDSF